MVMIRVVTAELKREVVECNRRRAMRVNDASTTEKLVPKLSSPSSTIHNSSTHFITNAASLTNLIGTHSAEGLLRNTRHRGVLSEEGDRLLQAMFPEQFLSAKKAVIAIGPRGEEDAKCPPSDGPHSTSATPTSSSLTPANAPQTATAAAPEPQPARANSAGPSSSQAKKVPVLETKEAEENVQWTFAVDDHYNVVLKDKQGNIKPHPSTVRRAMKDAVAPASLSNGQKGISDPAAITPAVVNKLSYKHPIFATERIQLLAHVAVLAGLATGPDSHEQKEKACRNLEAITEQILCLLPQPIAEQQRSQKEAEEEALRRKTRRSDRTKALATVADEADALIQSLKLDETGTQSTAGEDAHSAPNRAPPSDSSAIQLSPIRNKSHNQNTSNTSAVGDRSIGTGTHFVWTPPSMADSSKGGVIPRAGRDDHDEKVATLRRQLVQNLKAKEKEKRKMCKVKDEGKSAQHSRGGSEGNSDNDTIGVERGKVPLSPRKMNFSLDMSE